MNRNLSIATAITLCFIGACAVVCGAASATGTVNGHACVLASSKPLSGIYVCPSPAGTLFGVRNGATERLNIRGIEGHQVNNKVEAFQTSPQHVLIKYGDELAESPHGW